MKEINGGSFLIAATSIKNSYELSNVKKIHDTTTMSSLRFLVSVMCSIEEQYLKTDFLNKSEDAEEYVSDVLLYLKDKNNLTKICIFIDEFEDLLATQRMLTLIISGIKEVINGEYEPIAESGILSGFFHIVIAATPDSFYKIQTFQGISEIFGGLGRRTGIIRLPPVSLEEGVHFLFELLEYAYDYSLPEILPINDAGFFQGTYYISQGNLGNMVSLLTRLLSSAIKNDEEINIINYDDYLRFFKRTEIYVFGANTDCLDSNRYDKIIDILKEGENDDLRKNCVLLFDYLIGHFRPISEKEINKVGKH
jgi:hypothetical protein